MLSVKKGDIKYHFLSLLYDSTGDRTQLSRAMGEHPNHYANVWLRYELYPLLNSITGVLQEKPNH